MRRRGNALATRCGFCVTVRRERLCPVAWRSMRRQEESVTVEWQIRDEANAVVQEGQAGPGLSAVEVRFLKGQRHVRIEIPAPQGLSLGYYNLTIQAKGLVGGSVGTMRVIVAPRQCYVPPSLEANQRLWGLALQLYSLSSDRNWGMR